MIESVDAESSRLVYDGHVKKIGAYRPACRLDAVSKRSCPIIKNRIFVSVSMWGSSVSLLY